MLRPVARTVFRPVPERRLGARRADARAGCRRGRPGRARARPRRVRPPAQGAGRIARAGAGRVPGVRERARDALVELGIPADERAERLSPEEFRELAAQAPGAVRLRARAPGKVNLCLFLGPVRADGRHELVTLFESVSLADELDARDAGRRGATTRSCARASRDRTSCRALDALRDARLGRAAGADRRRQADPGRRRHGRRLGRRRGGAAAGGRLAPGRPTEVIAARRVARRRRPEPARARARCSGPAPATSSSPYEPLAPHASRDRAAAVRPVDRGRLPRGRPPGAAARRRRADRALRAAARPCSSPARGSRRADRQRSRAGGGVAVPGDRRRAGRTSARRRRPTRSCPARARPSLGCSGGRTRPTRHAQRLPRWPSATRTPYPRRPVSAEFGLPQFA